ncbi:hypothetical protein BC938DRAFT_477825 [Jimgerdemannia flammicorona]|uniref:Uncharacterized protein n=1 Tax=Jimgerdemannia flammicorona TaxID=994334 RepID=A0A433QYT9_9FUNG|nr:hypothetical protein BC938DRAFT_477825 [Jimgerdemannia flammicorona]
MRLFCGLGGVIITDVRVQGGDEHERLIHDGVDALLVSLDADYTMIREGNRRVGKEADRLHQVLDQNRLEDVELWRRWIEKGSQS